ncbi:MAG TPA: tetratricopeptide repeat protein, partial [Bacillota bacterium]|nr:tetratricopeptide repeat protein [Bacillota bacterium]
EAAVYYRRILEMDPNLFSPRRYLGNVLVAQGKAEEAIPHFLAALKIRPEDADTHVVLSLALLERGRLDEAVAQLREATRLQPTNSMAHYQLGLVSQSRGQTREAIEHYHQALKPQPDWPEALNNLAWVLAANPDPSLRNGVEAIALAERACRLTGRKEAIYLGTLAAAYAEAGRFDEAVSTAEEARRLALAAGQQEIAQKNQELLQVYRSGRAYHEAK